MIIANDLCKQFERTILKEDQGKAAKKKKSRKEESKVLKD